MTRWVLVTRSAAQCRDLDSALAGHGMRVVPFPTLRLAPVEDAAGWSAVTAKLSVIAWVAFTSARAPAPLTEQARSRGVLTQLHRIPAGAVGRATAEAALAAGYRVVLTGNAGGENLARQVIGLARPGQLVLHACGHEPRPELAETLTAAGLVVLPLVVYTSELVPPDQLPALPEGSPTAVVLSSPRAARGYVQACGQRFASAPHFAFGRTTAEAAAELGITATALREPNDACLLEELCPTS